MKRAKILLATTAVIALAVIVGCSGGGGDSAGGAGSNPPPQSSKTSGYLVDAKVVGLDYECAGGNSGTTDSDGHFSCDTLPVTFKLCNITLGSISQSSTDIVYPQDILGKNKEDYNDNDTIALARLLISVDDDGDVSDAITIDPSLCSALTTTEAFDAGHVEDYITTSGKTAVSEQAAADHLKTNYIEHTMRGNQAGDNVKFKTIVETCDLDDNGTGGISSQIQTWVTSLDAANDGSIELEYNYNGQSSTIPFYTYSGISDFGMLDGFSLLSTADNAQWKTYKFHENDELNVYQGSFVEENSNIDEKAREVFNIHLYGDGSIDPYIREDSWRHEQNLDCQDSRPEEVVGCDYMWQASINYTFHHNDIVADEYTISASAVSVDNIVLAEGAVDLYRADNLNQCLYPDEQHQNNAQGYPMLSTHVPLEGESQRYTPTCSGNGCSTLSIDETYADVSFLFDDDTKLIVDTNYSPIACAVTITQDMRVSIDTRQAFNATCDNLLDPNPDDSLSLTIAITPKAYHRDIHYCQLDDMSGECAPLSGATNVVYLPDFTQ